MEEEEEEEEGEEEDEDEVVEEEEEEQGREHPHGKRRKAGSCKNYRRKISLTLTMTESLKWLFA